jgi:nucleotide-binding universal stress UspA family protein
MLERILVPLDGSQLADQILVPMRATLSRSSDVSLLTVVPSHAIPKDHSPGQDPLTVARRHLAARRDDLIAHGVCAHARLTVGDAASKILEAARGHGSTLIVMSTHGRSGAARFLRGSVAERVLRHSPIPVLVANPRALEGREEPRFRRILVPLDGSDRSAEILPLVAELAKLHGSEVILFFSIPMLVSPEPIFASGPVMSVAEGEQLLEPFQRGFYDVPVKRRAAIGDPASNILALIESEKIDLVAMTTHGRSGPSRWFLGSVAEQVTRHATCPLLIKRTGGPPLGAAAAAGTAEAARDSATSVH